MVVVSGIVVGGGDVVVAVELETGQFQDVGEIPLEAVAVLAPLSVLNWPWWN